MTYCDPLTAFFAKATQIVADFFANFRKVGTFASSVKHSKPEGVSAISGALRP